nr:conserved oligomeric golgi complex subunit 2 [Quercus suber]
MAPKMYIPSDPVSTSTSTPAYTTESDSDDIDTLPYPAELSRKDFLSPTFDPQVYLSTLRNRHQTLEDLRSDLRQRSQLLSQELLDLVNSNYEEFLSLGSDLKGGEEKVEGVRVGLLGFEREIEGIQKAVQERSIDMQVLLQERRTSRREIGLGRGLLEVEEKTSELESSLGIQDGDELAIEADELDDADEENGNAAFGAIPVTRLRRHSRDYVMITRNISRLQSQFSQETQTEAIGSPSVHPFLRYLQPRLDEIRKTLLLDLAAALKQAKAAKVSDAMLAIVKIYADLGAGDEVARVLKGS